MNLDKFNSLSYPLKISMVPVALEVTLNTTNGIPAKATRADGKVDKYWTLHGLMKSAVPLKNGDNHGLITITSENFINLAQWLWEYQVGGFDNIYDVLVGGVQEWEAWITFIGNPDFTKQVGSVGELIDFCKEIFNTGVVIKDILINDELFISDIPRNDQGVYKGTLSAPLITATGRISNTLNLEPLTKLGYSKLLDIGKSNFNLAKDILFVANHLLPQDVDTDIVFDLCPACNSPTLHKFNESCGNYEICDNPSCPSITTSFIESMTEQTGLPFDVISTHFSDGSYISYSGSTVEIQSMQELGVNRLRTMLDVVGRGGLISVLSYIYGTFTDKPRNVRLEAVDELLNTHVSAPNNGTLAYMDNNGYLPPLRIMLIGFDDPHLEFGMNMLLRKLNIQTTSIVEEASLIFSNVSECDSLDDEFLEYVKLSSNIYIYNTRGDVKALMREMKKLTDIHYLSE